MVYVTGNRKAIVEVREVLVIVVAIAVNAVIESVQQGKVLNEGALVIIQVEVSERLPGASLKLQVGVIESISIAVTTEAAFAKKI